MLVSLRFAEMDRSVGDDCLSFTQLETYATSPTVRICKVRLILIVMIVIGVRQTSFVSGGHVSHHRERTSPRVLVEAAGSSAWSESLRESAGRARVAGDHAWSDRGKMDRCRLPFRAKLLDCLERGGRATLEAFSATPTRPRSGAV